MSFQKALITNFVKVGVFRYSGLISAFIGQVIISRFISPQEYGIFAIVIIFSGFLNIFLDTGLTMVIIREKEEDAFHSIVQFFFILLGLLLGFFMALTSYPISQFYNNDALILPFLVYSIILPLNALPMAKAAVLQKRNQFGIIARTGLISSIFSVSLTIVFAILGFSYWALIIPQIISPLLMEIIYRKYIKIDFVFPSNTEIAVAWNRIKSLTSNISKFSFLNYLTRNADNFFVGKVYSETSLGLYSRAYQLNSLPGTMLNGILLTVQLPSFQLKLNNKEDISKEFKSLFILLCSITFPFLFIFNLYGESLCYYLYGEKWMSAGTYLSLLSIFLLVYIPISSTGPMFILYKKENLLFKNSLIAATSTILLIIIGVFFSIETMIILLISSLLFINVTTTSYYGLHKTLGFDIVTIIKLWSVNWSIAIILLLLYIFDLTKFNFIPILLFSAISILRIVHYFRHNFQ